MSVRENIGLFEDFCPDTGQIVLKDLMGPSHYIHRIQSEVQMVAATDYSVTIQGETGVGKELVARAIHSYSHRALEPFVALDCATVPDSLFESELFGYEKGAFTGANSRKAGYFYIANGGTIFLDEVTNLPLEAQKKLLRAVEERKVRPLGGRESIRFDVRFLAACNVPLKESVDSGQFRKDLYYRVNEFSIFVPPLRQRVEDITFLAKKFLREICFELGKEIDGFSQDAIELLNSYSYPGNVRELRNIVRQVALLCRRRVEKEDLYRVMGEKKEGELTCTELASLDEGLSLKEISRKKVEEVERRLIIHALNRALGNKRKACKLLKIDYKTLFNKLRAYNITRSVL